MAQTARWRAAPAAGDASSKTKKHQGIHSLPARKAGIHASLHWVLLHSGTVNRILHGYVFITRNKRRQYSSYQMGITLLFRARKKERRRSTVDAAQKGAQQGTSFSVGGTRGRGNVFVPRQPWFNRAKSCIVYVCHRLYKPAMNVISMGYHSLKAKKPPLSGRFSLTWRGCLTPCSSGRPRRSACSRWLPAPVPS